MAEKLVVSVVGAETEIGKHIRRRTPSWVGLLGEQVEVDPETAVFTEPDDRTRVRVWAKALSGQQMGVTITPITSMLVLTPEQEATIRRYARRNATKTTETASIP